MDRVDPSPARIDGVGKDLVVGADLPPTDGHELMAFCQFVGIEHHFFRRFKQALLAAVEWILLAVFVARVVKVTVFLVRHGLVRLLDPAFDFLEQSFLELFGVGRHGCGVFVFGFEVVDDFLILAILEPVIVVDTNVAVFGEFIRHRFGLGRLGHLFRTPPGSRLTAEKAQAHNAQDGDLQSTHGQSPFDMQYPQATRSPTRWPRTCGFAQYNRSDPRRHRGGIAECGLRNEESITATVRRRNRR